MIEIRLKELAERLGKSILDISRDTGLNRNTVTGLYHNKVDGIKFSTLDVLCDTYGLTLEDLISRKEFRLGASIKSRIEQRLSSVAPFYSWHHLQALHQPSKQFFELGAGSMYAFFVRDEVELYFDRLEVQRCAKEIYATAEQNGLKEAHTTFLRARDQLIATIAGIAAQPVEQFVTGDIVKTIQRLGDLYADVLAVSAWIDVFGFGVRDDILAQIQQAHGFTASDISLLVSSGEATSAILRRRELIELAEKQSETQGKRFLLKYPFISSTELTQDLDVYLKHPTLLQEEKDVLSHLTSQHATAVKDVLRAHKLRVNPLKFFAELTTWREERDEIERHVHFQFQRLLNVCTQRFHIAPKLMPYFLPQELEQAQKGLVTERTLQYRSEHGLLIAFERGEYSVSEGERAVSIQDDLASRYHSMLTYEDIP